jgi:hypothetical protein
MKRKIRSKLLGDIETLDEILNQQEKINGLDEFYEISARQARDAMRSAGIDSIEQMIESVRGTERDLHDEIRGRALDNIKMLEESIMSASRSARDEFFEMPRNNALSFLKDFELDRSIAKTFAEDMLPFGVASLVSEAQARREDFWKSIMPGAIMPQIEPIKNLFKTPGVCESLNLIPKNFFEAADFLPDLEKQLRSLAGEIVLADPRHFAFENSLEYLPAIETEFRLPSIEIEQPVNWAQIRIEDISVEMQAQEEDAGFGKFVVLYIVHGDRTIKCDKMTGIDEFWISVEGYDQHGKFISARIPYGKLSYFFERNDIAPEKLREIH